MLTVLKNIEEKLQNAGGADKAGSSVYVSKIVENLIQLNTMLEAATRDDIIKQYSSVKSTITMLISFSYDEKFNEVMLSRIIGRVLINILKLLDFMKISEIIKEILEIITKTKGSTRILAASMTNLILRNVAEIEYFPGGAINEIFQTVSKVNKGASEAGLKMVTLSAIRYLIKQKLMMSTSNVAEIFKIIQRSVSEKVEELKIVGYRTLKNFLKIIPLGEFYNNHELCINLCTKSLEENPTEELKRQISFCLAEIVILKDKFEKEPSNVQKIKKLVQYSKDGDPINEAIEFFLAYAYKANNSREAYYDGIFLCFLNFRSQIKTTNLSTLIDGVINYNQKVAMKKDLELSGHYVRTTKLLESVATLLTETLKVTYWEIICDRLRIIAQKKEHGGQPTADKKRVYIASVGKWTNDALMLLSILNQMTSLLGVEFIDKYPKPNVFVDIMERYLTTSSNQLQLQSAEVIGNLINLFPKWRAQLLSKFINQLQMARADLNILASSRDVIDVDEFDHKFHSLKGNIYAAVNLSRNIDFENVSIPFDLANSIFEAGKSLIAENNSEGVSRNYGYLGWILISGVMSIDYHWIGSRLKTLMDLWKNVFGNEETFEYTEEALIEKVLAAKSLRKFLGMCKKLHNDSVLKLTGSFLCGYISYIITAEKTKGILKKGTPMHTVARSEAFRCALRMNPLYFASKLNSLLQVAIEEVSNYYDDDLLQVAQACLGEDCELARIMESGGKSIPIAVKQVNDSLARERVEIAKSIVGCELVDDGDATSLERRSTRLATLQSEIMFIGHAFSSPNFSLKNKVQLVKFLTSNSKQFATTKDLTIRNLRLLALLLVCYSIVKKYYVVVQENKSIELKSEIFDAIRETCENCWLSTSNYVRCAAGIVYGMVFALYSAPESIDALFKTMFDSLNDPNLIPTQAATIGYMLKYGKNNIDDKAAIQIFNIFQKSSRILDESTKVWLGNSLMMALEHTSDKVMREMLKTCLPFTMILHLRCKDSSKALLLIWAKIFEKLSKQEKLAGISHYQLEAILLDSNETFYSGSDFVFKISKLLLTKSQIQGKKTKGTLKKMEKLLAKIQSPQNLGFNATITKLQVECITDILQRQSSSELALLEKKTNKMIISKLVALATLKPRKKSLFDALCQNFLDAQLEQLKLKISSFEDQFLFIRDVIFKAGNEGSQTVIDEEEKEREAPVRKTSQEPLFDFTLELPMHPSLQYFALKSLESLLYITNLQSFKARDVVNFGNLVIPFVFKIASLNMEKLQEMGLKLFLNVFKKLYNFTEFGEPVEVQSEPERAQSGLLMRQYGAQIDALIKLNMKNLSESSAKCILHAFKLFHKFCKLMLWVDADMVRKIFVIVSQGVIQPLKLSQSTYHSERELTQIHVLRIKILCKIYNYITVYNTGVDINVFYPNWLCTLIKQHSQAILRDSLYILTLRRRELKTQEKFYFVYNGHKISYDEHIFFDSIPTLIKTLLKLEHVEIDKEELESLDNKEISKVIMKNHKTLVDITDDDRHHYQILILIFALCHNEAIDLASENNSKRLRKLYPSHLAQMFKFKNQVLKILLDVMEKTFVPEDQIVADLVHLLFKYVMLGNDDIALSILKIYKCAAMKEKISKDTYRIISTYIIEIRNTLRNDDRNTFINRHELLELCYQTFIPIFDHCLENISVKGAQDLLNEDVLDEICLYLKLFVEDFQDPEASAKKQVLATLLQAFKSLLKRYQETEQEQEKKLLGEIIHDNLSALIEPVLSTDPSPQDLEQIGFRIILELLFICDSSEESEFARYQTDLLSKFLATPKSTKTLLQYLRNDWKQNNGVQINALPFFMAIVSSKIDQVQRLAAAGKIGVFVKNNEENECVIEIFKVLAFIFLDTQQAENARTTILVLSFRYYVIINKAGLSAACLNLVKQLLNHQVGMLNENQKHEIETQLGEDERKTVFDYFPGAKPSEKKAKAVVEEDRSIAAPTGGEGTIQLKKGLGFGFRKKQ